MGSQRGGHDWATFTGTFKANKILKFKKNKKIIKKNKANNINRSKGNLDNELPVKTFTW